ncbi:MAG: hypothetical protein IIW81_01755, partial [Oscillospiraceae bacterium]|nr:hypothetical protein [Oscillospiraceae bacterium]
YVTPAISSPNSSMYITCANVVSHILGSTMPQVVLTSLFSFPFCLLFRWLHGKFEPETTKV